MTNNVGHFLKNLYKIICRATTDAVYVDVNMDNVYDLFGIVHHMGTSTDSGHYTATTKNPIDGKWRYFDDTVVQEVTSPTTIESSTVYLLFYERRSARRQINCSSSGKSFAFFWKRVNNFVYVYFPFSSIVLS